jgi:tetratricopeptide (TPR) repeat protein
MKFSSGSATDPSSAQPARARSRGRFIRELILFGLALGARLIFLLEIRSFPLFQYPILDMRWHRQWAEQILAGDWMGKEVFFRAPLYPYFLALVMGLGGPGYFWPRLLQSLAGCLTPVLLYRLAEELGLRPRAALGAGLAAAIYPLFIYYDTEFLAPVLSVPLDLALLLTLARRRPEDKLRAWLLPGGLLGLSAITRPTILIFVPGLAAGMALTLFRRNWSGLATRLGALLFAAGLVILPVTIRNALVGRDFVLIASQGGINFWIGNNPNADGKTAMAAGPEIARGEYRDNVWLTSEIRAERALGRRLKPSEISSYWFRQGLSFFRRDPAGAGSLFLRKVYFLLNGTEIPDNQSIYYYRNESVLFRSLVWRGPLKLPFGLLLPLAAAGIFFSWRERSRFLLLYFFLLTYGLGIALFFVTARFRITLVPVLILLAAFAIQEWNRRRRELPAYPLLAGFLILSNTNAGAVNVEDEAKPYDCMGSRYYDQKNYAEAHAMYAQALALDPNNVAVLNNLGTVALTEGKAEEAADYFERAAFQAPDQALVFNTLGLARERQGRLADAEEVFLKALDLDPAYPAYLANLNRVRQALGKPLLKLRTPAQTKPSLEVPHE